MRKKITTSYVVCALRTIKALKWTNIEIAPICRSRPLFTMLHAKNTALVATSLLYKTSKKFPATRIKRLNSTHSLAQEGLFLSKSESLTTLMTELGVPDLALLQQKPDSRYKYNPHMMNVQCVAHSPALPTSQAAEGDPGTEATLTNLYQFVLLLRGLPPMGCKDKENPGIAGEPCPHTQGTPLCQMVLMIQHSVCRPQNHW